MSDFYGTTGTDVLVGDTTPDTFYFTPEQIQNSDKIIGGSGGGDRLIITTNGFADVNLFQIGLTGSGGQISGLEQIQVQAALGSAINVTTDIVNTATGSLSILGSAGNDYITSYQSDSGALQTGRLNVYGGAGNDNINSIVAANNAFFGGDGEDTLIGRASYLDGGNDNDYLLGYDNSVAYGGSGNDRMELFSNSFSYGGAGADLMTAFGNNVLLDGGDDNDRIVGNASSRINGGAGNDYIELHNNRTNDPSNPRAGLAQAGDGDDLIVVANPELAIYNIDGGNGRDTLYATGVIESAQITNVEVLSVYGNNVTLSAAKLASFQSITTSDNWAVKLTMTGSGIINFGSMVVKPWMPVVVRTMSNSDFTYIGTVNDDQFYGGRGNDTIHAGPGNDFIVTSEYVDNQSGSDTAYGGSGDDTFLGSGTNDRLYGGVGNDKFFAVGGTIDGGDGIDSVIYNKSIDTSLFSNIERLEIDPNHSSLCWVTVSCERLSSYIFAGSNSLYAPYNLVLTGDGIVNLANVVSSAGFTATVVERTTGVSYFGSVYADYLTGSEFADAIRGAGGADILYGGAGDDYLEGGVGYNQLFGDAGNDAAFGGDGVDVIDGGLGDDYLKGNLGGDYIRGGGGNDRLFGGGGDDKLTTSKFDSLTPGAGGTSYAYGGEGADTIILQGRGDLALGEAGNDTITSSTLEATNMYGGSGDDKIAGNYGFDVLSGGEGADILSGAFGSDYYLGGTGSDQFRLNLEARDGDVDVIADFEAGVDTIVLHSSLLTASITDTSAGVRILYASLTGKYSIFISNSHSVTDVTNAITYYDFLL